MEALVFSKLQNKVKIKYQNMVYISHMSNKFCTPLKFPSLNSLASLLTFPVTLKGGGGSMDIFCNHTMQILFTQIIKSRLREYIRRSLFVQNSFNPAFDKQANPPSKPCLITGISCALPPTQAPLSPGPSYKQCTH